MRILADSHVLLWWLDDPQLIAAPLRSIIADPTHDVFFSAASIWELGIKVANGRLRMPADIVTVLEADGFEELPVTSLHAMRTLTLPFLHRDPFDRLLIAQALVEGLVLATRDRMISSYDVPVVDA